MSERYASWSTADHAYALEHVDGVSVLGAVAGGCRTAPSTAPPSHKRRQRSLELRTVLDGPLRLSKLPGSGSEQAPEVLSLLVDAGFRAVHQPSPPGVAIFTDTKPDTEIDLLSPEHALLRLMLALDPAHAAYEEQYSAYERRRLLCRRLASRILALRPRMQLEAEVSPLLEAAPETDDALEGVVSSTIRAVAEPMGVSVHQLEREWERLVTVHSTLANSCLERFCAATGVHLQDATLMVSQQPARERILLLLYDRVVHEVQQWPRPFSWVPSLSKVLEMRSAERLGQAATESLWEELRKGGFWPSSALRDQLRPLFEGWFRTCFMTHGGIPLRAALSPKQPLCLYLHGTAGSGKSSLVRSLLPAIACAVRGWLNPGLQAGFVKQGLNKEISALNLEFERRPNNNDLSVVSVVEMAREPLAAVSPKLLLLGLEEMPASAADGAATAHEERSGLERAASQEEAAALLAERFSKTVAHPDMIVAFSSNYELCGEAHAKLRKCPLFSGVLPVFVRPVDGAERRDLARQLIRRRLLELLKDCQAKVGPTTLAIEVSMRLGEGDVRPLVRELRAVAAFGAKMLREVDSTDSLQLLVEEGEQAANTVKLVLSDSSTLLTSIELRRGPNDLLLPIDGTYLDARTSLVISKLPSVQAEANFLPHVIDYYFSTVLAPAVIVSTDSPQANHLLDALFMALTSCPGDDVKVIHSVDPLTVKMNRALYDPCDARSLRDEILDLQANVRFIVVEFLASDAQAQLLIREMIEDSPSSVAHSVHKRILYKSGLLFIVRLGHTHSASPELKSRASIIL